MTPAEREVPSAASGGQRRDVFQSMTRTGRRAFRFEVTEAVVVVRAQGAFIEHADRIARQRRQVGIASAARRQKPLLQRAAAVGVENAQGQCPALDSNYPPAKPGAL
jgi:hypothetical protein